MNIAASLWFCGLYSALLDLTHVPSLSSTIASVVINCTWGGGGGVKTLYSISFLHMVIYDNITNDCALELWKSHISAVYTCIKKPESFSHSGFSLKVARQLPLNTPKNPNRKTHLRSVIFWNSAKISLFFCQCKRSLQSRRYYSGFWSRGTWPSAESPDRGPRRNAHYTCTVKGREVAHAHHLPKHKYEIRVFSRMRFSCQKPRCYGFFWQCKRYNKKPRFFGFWFFPM